MPDLVRLLRALPGDGAVVRGAAAGADWQRLGEAASIHGLTALVWHVMHAFAPDSVKREALQTSALSMRTRALALRALDALAAEGLVPVFLKGVALAARLYAETSIRPSTDVDLLVRRSDLPAAERAMRSIGLESTGGPTEDYMRAHHHSVNFYGQAGMVELHFRALSVGTFLDGQVLLNRSIDGTFEGRRVRYLSPEDELVHLAEHVAGHLMVRLVWLYDIKLFLRKYRDLDWSAVVRIAREFGVQGPVFFGLEAARRLVGADVPTEVLRQLQPSRWQAALAPLLFDEDRIESNPVLNKYVAHLYTTLIGSDLPHMWRHASHNASRGLRRKVAFRFPRLFPDHWRA